MKASDILKPTLTLFLICLVLAAALAGTNAVTAEPIAEQSRIKANESRSIVLSNADEYEDAKLSGVENEVYYGLKDGQKIGCTITSSAKGYGGDVVVMVGIDFETNSVTGISILSHNETPGLGANATNESFRDQYKGYTYSPSETDANASASVDADSGGSEIQALTGATITSNAVKSAVNSAMEIYYEHIKGAE